MKIIQSTVERLLYVLIFILLLISIATFVKLTNDDAKKFKVLNHNQNVLICVVKGFTDQPPPANFIDNCVKNTK